MRKDLGQLVADLRRKYGPRVIKLGSEVCPPERIPTGIAVLDNMLGGGWPKGRISELWGPQSSGKSTLALKTVAALQAVNKKARVCYLDQENTFDKGWAETLGVRTDRLMHVSSMAAEDAGKLIVRLIADGWDLIVLDSVPEMLPGKELDREPEEESYAPVARVLSRLLPKIVVLQSRSDSALLVVNQVRDKIGFFFGDDKRSPGGHALFHLDTFKVRVQRAGRIEENKKVVGYKLAVRLVKSKLGGEGNECFVRVLYGKGPVD